VSRRTAVRHTFRVTEAPANPRFPRSGPAWFVKALVGPDNGSDYIYIGMLRAPAAGGVPTFSLTSGSRATPDDARVKGLNWLFDAMRQYDTNPAAVAAWEACEVWHADACARCGRPLTDPSSIAARLGPECYQHVHGAARPTVAPTPVAAPVAPTPVAAPAAPVAVEATPAPAEPAPAVEAPAPRKGRRAAAKAAPTPAPVEVVEAPAAHPMKGPSGFLF
jgi:hypothetical protein